MENLTVVNKTEERTPIEIALEVDEEGMVLVRHLYDWLEYDSSNYSRWCKDNLINNPSLEENVDFKAFRRNDENPLGGRPSDDYSITLELAKELAMMARSERGKAARKYFNKIEGKFAFTVKQYNELLDCYKQAITMIEEVQTKQNELMEKHDTLALEIKDNTTAINKLESGRSISGGHQSDWAFKWHTRVRRLADAWGLTVSATYDRIFNLMGDMHSFIWKDVKESYIARHPEEGKDPWRIDVIDEAKGELGLWFIEAYNELAAPYNLEDEEAYAEIGYFSPKEMADSIYFRRMGEEEFDNTLQGFYEYCLEEEEKEKTKKNNDEDG